MRGTIFNGDFTFTCCRLPRFPIDICSDTRLLPLMTREAENAEPIMLRVGAVGLYSYDTAHIGSPLRLDRRVTLTG
ncbi:MAG: hypothetical protein R2826_11095 [Thermoleophilia bacterium]